MQKFNWIGIGFVLGVLCTMAMFFTIGGMNGLFKPAAPQTETETPRPTLADGTVSDGTRTPTLSQAPQITDRQTQPERKPPIVNNANVNEGTATAKQDPVSDSPSHDPDFQRTDPGPNFVYGIVVDLENHVIEGATVELFEYATMQSVESMTTNARGEFQFHVGADRQVALRASKGAYSKAVTQRASPADGEIVIRLQDPAILTGRVIDASTGAGVDDFTLIARELNELGVPQEELSRSRQLPSDWQSQISKRFSASGGYFVIDNLPPGTYAIYVYPETHSMAVYTGTEGRSLHELPFSREGLQVGPGDIVEDVIIKVEPATLARGYVQGETGEPISGAEVSIWYGGALGGVVTVPVPEDRRTTTDSKGWFEINLSNPYAAGSLRFDAEGYISRTVHYTQFYTQSREEDGSTSLAPKTPPATVILESDARGGAVFGKVTDDSGVPQPGQVVILDGYLGLERQLTNESGEYRFSGLMSGKYKLYLDGAFGNLESRPDEIILHAGREIERNFSPSMGVRVYGTALWGTTPLAGKEIELYGKTEGGARLSRTCEVAADGKFEVDHIDAGSYALTVREKGSVSPLSTLSVPVQVSGDKDVPANIRMPGTSVFGTITDPDGNAIQNAQVFFQMVTVPSDLNNPANFQAVTGKDGAFEVIGLVPTDYRVRISARHFKAMELEQGIFILNDQRRDLGAIQMQPLTSE